MSKIYLRVFASISELIEFANYAVNIKNANHLHLRVVVPNGYNEEMWDECKQIILHRRTQAGKCGAIITPFDYGSISIRVVTSFTPCMLPCGNTLVLMFSELSWLMKYDGKYGDELDNIQVIGC